MRALVAIGLAAVLAASAAAAPAKPPATPSFRVDVSATLVRHNVRHIVAKPQSNGCVLRTDSDATSSTRFRLRAPAVLTYRQLLHGVFPFATLVATETRGGTYRYGYDTTAGCPYSGQAIRESATSGCGTKSFKVLSLFDAVGFMNRTNRFRFTVHYSAGDAFDGACVADVFVGENEIVPNSVGVFLPPDAWQAAKLPYWKAVSPRSLLAGKRVVISFEQTRTIPTLAPVGNPAAYTEATLTDEYTVAWTVTLTPRD